MSDWKVTDIEDDDYISKQFVRISKATQFKPVWPYYLGLYVSYKEYYLFRNVNIINWQKKHDQWDGPSKSEGLVFDPWLVNRLKTSSLCILK